jgi:hypothetical protein
VPKPFPVPVREPRPEKKEWIDSNQPVSPGPAWVVAGKNKGARKIIPIATFFIVFIIVMIIVNKKMTGRDSYAHTVRYPG